MSSIPFSGAPCASQSLSDPIPPTLVAKLSGVFSGGTIAVSDVRIALCDELQPGQFRANGKVSPCKKTEPFLQLPQVMNSLGREVLFTQDFSNHRKELGVIHRLLQKCLGVGLERPLPIGTRVARGHDNYRN